LTSNPSGNYWLLTLTNGNGIIAQKVHFFTQPKNFQLTKPTIVSKIEKMSDKWIITLKTNTLAKDVYLNFEGDEGFFEDNYFDLLPGKTKTVFYNLKASKKPTNELSVISLWNSYNE
jgi:beta-mannosidase